MKRFVVKPGGDAAGLLIAPLCTASSGRCGVVLIFMTYVRTASSGRKYRYRVMPR